MSDSHHQEAYSDSWRVEGEQFSNKLYLSDKRVSQAMYNDKHTELGVRKPGTQVSGEFTNQMI